jgi:hypothetical protein
MVRDFVLPEGMVGRFAIVKLWPDIKTAEDECIARLKIAAAGLGLECFEILADGRYLEQPTRRLARGDVDFVFHLHYDTPKMYDAFSIVALWNPIQFYHEWGYARTSRNLLSHDDFISCSSQSADDHVARLVRNAPTHLPPLFNLYHSTASTIHPPSLGDHKLFYAGINWEAISGGKSRHQEVLKRLDQTGAMRIYGPEVFQGVKVWAGYRSYVRGLPFDGISMIDEISKAGIALVLSSQAHKNAALMSNRLFESVAAGALVICDENPFAKKYFGDSLLYIDGRCSIETMVEDIQRHLAWAEAHPQEALAMIARAQKIFTEKFTLTRNLADLYNGLKARQAALLERNAPAAAPRLKVQLNLLMPDDSDDVLAMHLASVRAQQYEHFSATLFVDAALSPEARARIEAEVARSPVPVALAGVAFFNHSLHRSVTTRRRLGEVLTEVLARPAQADAVVFVAPNEKLLSNHLSVLAGSLARNPSAPSAATAVVYDNGTGAAHSVNEDIAFHQLRVEAPIGYARFMLRVAALPRDLRLYLPYLDRKTMAILCGGADVVQELPSTVLIQVASEFPPGSWDEGQENELISSFSPTVFAARTGHAIILPSLSLPVVVQGSNILPERPRHPLGWFVFQSRLMRRDGARARLAALTRRIERKLA